MKMAAPRNAMRSVRLGPVEIGRQWADVQGGLRRAQESARHRPESFHLIMNVLSNLPLSTDGTLRLRAGDVVLVDADYAARLELQKYELIHLSMSRTWLRQWVPTPSMLLGRPIRGDSGWGQALSCYLRQLTPEFVATSPLPAVTVLDQLGALLALVANDLGSSSTCSAGGVSSLHDRIRSAVRERSAETSLTAAEVAASLGISPRTLHRTLAAHGEAFATLLMNARVDVAVRMLESSAFAALTHAEIGRRAGFADASHFTRVIRSRTGRTPTQIRNAMMGE